MGGGAATVNSAFCVSLGVATDVTTGAGAGSVGFVAAAIVGAGVEGPKAGVDSCDRVAAAAGAVGPSSLVPE